MCWLSLLFKQLSEHAGCLKLDIVEAVDRLRETPLQQHQTTHFTTLFTFYAKVVTIAQHSYLFTNHNFNTEMNVGTCNGPPDSNSGKKNLHFALNAFSPSRCF